MNKFDCRSEHMGNGVTEAKGDSGGDLAAPLVADSVGHYDIDGVSLYKNNVVVASDFMKFRIEKDSLGEVKVESLKLWGAQTQRALQNFKIGKDLFSRSFIKALGIIKKSAASVNMQLGKLDQNIGKLIELASIEVVDGKWDSEFPLVVWQSGSGTQTNMNANEVIANRAIQIGLASQAKKYVIHPNDHVNMSQSTNDVFSSAMHMAALEEIESALLPSIEQLENTLLLKSKKFSKIVKIGRTHLMDATPITLGQEISGWYRQICGAKSAIASALEGIRELPIGGSAVGTGLNTHPKYQDLMISKISQNSNRKFYASRNNFEAISSHDSLVSVSGALRRLACALMKISNDVRWLASGPRCGIGELKIPKNEPGSSMMPGKVNPTQCESMMMICVQVMGNDTAIGFAGSQGNFQLNVFKPIIIHNILQSIRLLSDGVDSFNKNCIIGIEPEINNINKHLNNSLMLVTALTERIGYEKSCQVVNKANDDGITLREAIVELGFLSDMEFDKCVIPENMTHP